MYFKSETTQRRKKENRNRNHDPKISRRHRLRAGFWRGSQPLDNDWSANGCGGTIGVLRLLSRSAAGGAQSRWVMRCTSKPPKEPAEDGFEVGCLVRVGEEGKSGKVGSQRHVVVSPEEARGAAMTSIDPRQASRQA